MTAFTLVTQIVFKRYMETMVMIPSSVQLTLTRSGVELVTTRLLLAMAITMSMLRMVMTLLPLALETTTYTAGMELIPSPLVLATTTYMEMLVTIPLMGEQAMTSFKVVRALTSSMPVLVMM